MLLVSTICIFKKIIRLSGKFTYLPLWLKLLENEIYLVKIKLK